MNILEILNEIGANPSRLAKEAILTREKDNELLKAVIVAAYHPYINYWIKKIPEAIQGISTNISLRLALDGREYLSARRVTGNAAIEYLAKMLGSMNREDAIVIERIIDRDLRAGFTDGTANKIWPGLIPTFDVMLSHKDISGIKYPAYAQTKMDGARCHVYSDGTSARAWSRQGKEFVLHGALDESAKGLMLPGETFDGELLFFKNNKPLDRKTSNGLANKSIKGTLSAEACDDVRFVVWDNVDFTSSLPYTKRFDMLNDRFNIVFNQQLNSRFLLVHSIVVNSEDEAFKFYNDQRANGEEGAILKNMNSVWQPKRTKDLGKMKAIEEADLLVTGWKEGKGKFAGMVGSLDCQTAEGIIKVNVSGFSDDVRKIAYTFVDKIITVLYNEIIKDKTTGEYSLFLPRFVEVRFDKTKANKFEDLK